ncbi:hypothetical protein [Terriglobus albidus]|uniref:hypothetical protein n=1 Tax=Terriglobus albidus TaxID=1592106 RepID=UPI0021DF95BB|nr:hypothetical protein [Terriglobus albidus]
MKSLSIYLLLLGIIWALLVGWMYLALSGIAEPISMMRVVLYFGGMLIGPLVLIVGSVLVLCGTYAKPGALLALLGCVVLTIFVVYQSLQALHVEPLQVQPPYLLYVIAVVVALLSDAGAFRLYQLVTKR